MNVPTIKWRNEIFCCGLQVTEIRYTEEEYRTIYCTVLLLNYTMLRIYTSNCFLAWSVFVWYAIKIDITPRPVRIFSDYGAIKEYIYVMLRKQTRKWQHQTSRQSLHSWEFGTRLWSCFSDSLKIVFFQTQQFCFPIHFQVTFNHWQTCERTTNGEVLHGHATVLCQTLSKMRITYEIST